MRAGQAGEVEGGPAGAALGRRPGRFVVVGNPASPQVEQFAGALATRGLAPPRVVPWLDVINGSINLADVIAPGDVLRLESPGRDFEVERQLLARGAHEIDEADPAGQLYSRLSPGEVSALTFDKGLILCPRQWYLGFRAVLRDLQRALAAAPPHRAISDAGDIQMMFDKRLCHVLLSAAAVPVPGALREVASFDQLMSQMRDAGWRRVFVKLAHGSSASGVVALALAGDGRMKAVTTVCGVNEGPGMRLYNSRRLFTLTSPAQIGALVDALARHRVHVEQWLPKAGISGRVFDLRVLVIAGRARHVVARLSRSPITNLHLLNDRAGPEAVQQKLGPVRWQAAMSECERAMTQCFPRSLHGGVDLLIGAGFNSHAILEINAFGDHLKGATCDGLSPYEAQLAEICGGVQ